MKTEEVEISKKVTDSGNINFGLSEPKLNNLFEKIDSGNILIQKVERHIIDECEEFQKKRIIIDYVESIDGLPLECLKDNNG